MKRRSLSRLGWLPAALLPLWALWVFSWFTLKGMEGWVERVPRHYGIHLYKEQVQGQLELFARVIDLFEKGDFRSQLEYLSEEYRRGEIDRMAVLFGLSAPVMIVEKDGFGILYPSGTSAPTGVPLEDPENREALIETLRRMVARGDKEGIFSLPDGGGPDTDDPGRHWYLSVAYSGGDLLCVLVVPEDSIHRSGEVLQAAQESRFREGVRRYLHVTLPVLALCSVWILVLAVRGNSPDLLP